jgi:hypothetical protein
VYLLIPINSSYDGVRTILLPLGDAPTVLRPTHAHLDPHGLPDRPAVTNTAAVTVGALAV